MRFFDFVSVKLTLGLILGILIGFHSEVGILLVTVLLITLVILLAILWKTIKRRSSPLFGLIAFTTTVLLGTCIISIGLPKNQPDHYQKFAKGKSQLKLKIAQVLKPNPYSYRYFAKVEVVDTSKTSGEVLFYVAKDSSAKKLSADDELLTYSSVDSIPPSLNPYQFNFKAYLEKQGVYGQVRIVANQYILLKEPSRTLAGIAANFRVGLIKKLQKQGFGSEQLGVIQALLLGQRNDISEETYTNYVNAGAVHILAVSGLHVGILLLLLQFLFRPLERLPKGKTIKLVTTVTLLWGYAFIAGLSPSIVRAVTMFSFLAYALYLNRPTSTFNILTLSMFFVLLTKPLFLFQIGFQMSYAAVFAIIWVYPKLQRFWFPKNRLVQKGWQLLSVSIAAQLGILPLSLFYFHQFPALFFVSNLLVIPFLGIILGLGILILGLTYFNALPQFLVSLYDGLIGAMNGIISWVAQQEGFLFTEIPFDGIQLILGYAIVLGVIISLSKPYFKNLAFLLISLVIYSGYLVIDVWKQQNEENLWLLHQTKNSVLLYQKDGELNVFTHHFNQSKKKIEMYKIEKRVTAIAFDTLQNHYTFSDKRLLIVDSTDIYGTIKNPDYVLLSQSPKIHLGRFLDSVRPKIILADGSNYISYVNRWEKTCYNRKLPFHYTGKKGAYKFKKLKKCLLRNFSHPFLNEWTNGKEYQSSTNGNPNYIEKNIRHFKNILRIKITPYQSSD